jgi:hypothetical protein
MISFLVYLVHYTYLIAKLILARGGRAMVVWRTELLSYLLVKASYIRRKYDKRCGRQSIFLVVRKASDNCASAEFCY